MKPQLLIGLFFLALTGCTSTEPLYYYGQYNSAVYQYFKAEDATLAEQIAILQSAIEHAAANNKPIAPGIHAHLGMLYYESGNSDLGRQHLEQEKVLFPESSQYINFLLNSNQDV
jgi:hypothetical protein